MQAKVKKINGFVRRKDQVVWKLVDRKGLLLNLDSGAYFDVNPVGLVLWKLCDGKKKIEQAILLASRELKLPSEQIYRDAYRFICDLKRNKLIEIVSKPASAVKFHHP